MIGNGYADAVRVHNRQYFLDQLEQFGDLADSSIPIDEKKAVTMAQYYEHLLVMTWTREFNQYRSNGTTTMKESGDMTTQKTATITDAIRITEENAVPLDDSSDLPPFEDGGDGGNRSCDWADDVCTELPTHYIICYCSNPNCKRRHTEYYCLRHYVMRLKDVADHLPHCSEYRAAHTRDERIAAVLQHIADFGPIAQS